MRRALTSLLILCLLGIGIARGQAGSGVQGGSTIAVQFCGTTTTCSATAQTGVHVVWGSVALASGSPSTATVTAISPAFTSTTSFKCTVSDQTAPQSAAAVSSYASGSSIVLSGANTVTDTVNYICIGT